MPASIASTDRERDRLAREADLAGIGPVDPEQDPGHFRPPRADEARDPTISPARTENLTSRNASPRVRPVDLEEHVPDGRLDLGEQR